jgi:hydroxymethylpyrimidine pyrophosphatase-like HAD family hydrolase
MSTSRITNLNNRKIIAVDFDGTLVEDKYPAIGKPMPFAIETLKLLQKEGHLIILWTYRSGKSLHEAVEFCEGLGIVFYAVNKSYPEEEFEKNMPRKIKADIFIDDRNIGGFLGWGKYYQLINPNTNSNLNQIPQKKKGFFGFGKG